MVLRGSAIDESGTGKLIWWVGREVLNARLFIFLYRRIEVWDSRCKIAFVIILYSLLIVITIDLGYNCN